MTPLSIIIRHDSCKIQNFSSVPGFRAPTYLDRIIANPALKSSRAGSMAVPWERQASAWTSWEASDGDGVVRTRVLSWVTRRGGEVRLRHPLCSAAASRYCALEKHSRKAGQARDSSSRSSRSSTAGQRQGTPPAAEKTVPRLRNRSPLDR